MVEIQPIRVAIEPDLPGVMAYSGTCEEAARKVEGDRSSSAGRHDGERRRSVPAAEGPVRGVSVWRAAKALIRVGWTLKKQVGSHRKLEGPGWPNFTFCFHDSEEIGPAALARIAKQTGLRPEDLWSKETRIVRTSLHALR
jgi:predicted RNA binding protein YcfA (HicA-like mRNA interferase family)